MATLTTPKNKQTQKICFGLFDSKGREIGAIARTFDAELIEDSNNERNFDYYGGKFGPVYAASVQASRNGESYGAGQRYCYFHSEADREAYLEKRIAASKKAAAKKATA